MRRSNSWYDRNEVIRISRDWVKTNVRITNREMELLKIIKYRKLVRRDMLEIISPSFRYLGNNRIRIINRSLRKLFESMCVDKFHEPQEFTKGNTPAIFSLDRAGSIMLEIPHKQRIKHIRSNLDGIVYIDRHLPSNFRHINGVNQLEVDTILFCEDTGNEITKWSLENNLELYYGQERVILIPDVSVSIKLSKTPLNEFNAYIEFDTGSESIRYREPPIIKEKIMKYKKYKLSKMWEDDYKHFPVILFVTEDEKRIDFFNRKCEENGLLGIGVYYKNYKKFLEKLNSIS